MGGGGPGAETSSLKAELSPTKIAAGAGAAVVTAILGSFLGAVGTVLGAAVGSLVTTVATTFFTRGIEHGRVRTVELKDRAAARKGRGIAAGTVAAAQDAAGPTGERTVRLDPAHAPGRARSGAAAPRRWPRPGRTSIVVAVVGGVLAFAVAMFLVTGIEFVKGSTITGGGTGTSIGNAVSGGAAPQPADTGRDGGEEASSEPSTAPSESAGESTDPTTSTGESGGSSEPQPQEDPGGTGDPLQERLDGLLPSQQPDSGQQGTDQGGSGGQGADGSGS